MYSSARFLFHLFFILSLSLWPNDARSMWLEPIRSETIRNNGVVITKFIQYYPQYSIPSPQTAASVPSPSFGNQFPHNVKVNYFTYGPIEQPPTEIVQKPVIQLPVIRQVVQPDARPVFQPVIQPVQKPLTQSVVPVTLPPPVGDTTITIGSKSFIQAPENCKSENERVDEDGMCQEVLPL